MSNKMGRKAIFALQKQIINAPGLSDAQKLKMLEDAIDETLGNAKSTYYKDCSSSRRGELCSPAV